MSFWFDKFNKQLTHSFNSFSDYSPVDTCVTCKKGFWHCLESSAHLGAKLRISEHVALVWTWPREKLEGMRVERTKHLGWPGRSRFRCLSICSKKIPLHSAHCSIRQTDWLPTSPDGWLEGSLQHVVWLKWIHSSNGDKGHLPYYWIDQLLY